MSVRKRLSGGTTQTDGQARIFVKAADTGVLQFEFPNVNKLWPQPAKYRYFEEFRSVGHIAIWPSLLFPLLPFLFLPLPPLAYIISYDMALDIAARDLIVFSSYTPHGLQVISYGSRALARLSSRWWRYWVRSFLNGRPGQADLLTWQIIRAK